MNMKMIATESIIVRLLWLSFGRIAAFDEDHSLLNGVGLISAR
jgi:hypothetical protein